MTEDNAAPAEQGNTESTGEPTPASTGNSALEAKLDQLLTAQTKMGEEMASFANFREQTRRHLGIGKKEPKEGSETPGKTGGSSLELENKSLRERLDALESKNAESAKASALDREIAAVSASLAEGAADIIRSMACPRLSQDSTGKVIVDHGDRHQELKEFVAEYAKNPMFQAPKGRGGTGHQATTPGTAPGTSDEDEIDYMTMSDADWQKAKAGVETRWRQ